MNHRIALPDVCRMLGDVTTATIRRLVRKGVLPPPLRISKKIWIWKTEDIEKALAEREQAAAIAGAV